MIQLEPDMIALLAAAVTRAHFSDNGAAHHIAAGQIGSGWRITLHEALAMPVHQKPALATRRFGN